MQPKSPLLYRFIPYVQVVWTVYTSYVLLSSFLFSVFENMTWILTKHQEKDAMDKFYSPIKENNWKRGKIF